MARQDQATVTVRGPGNRDLGIWDKQSGGAGDSDEVFSRPGATKTRRSHGGPTTVENLTLQKEAQDLSDDDARFLLAQRGQGSEFVATRWRTGNNLVAVGRPLVWRGTLKTVTPPDYDSESNNVAYWQIVISSISIDVS
jgi:hypothetical protein